MNKTRNNQCCYANQTKIMMNLQSNPQSARRARRIFILASVFLLPFLLAGCARPGEDKIHALLRQSYDCKNVEIAEIVRTDSLPGIYSYVAQYSFNFRFKEGEEGAKKYFKGLIAEMDLSKKDWETEMRSEKVQDYISDECNEAAQMVMERMADRVIPKILAGDKSVPLPYAVPVTGWSEFMPGRKGWDITMHRDHADGTPLFTQPVEREWLLGDKADAKSRKSKKSSKVARTSPKEAASRTK